MLKRIILPQGDPRGKWVPTYEGPFMVKKVFSGGEMMLMTMDGEYFPLTVNADVVKKYFAYKKREPTKLKTRKGSLGKKRVSR